jgi:hypothetical protein
MLKAKPMKPVFFVLHCPLVDIEILAEWYNSSELDTGQRKLPISLPIMIWNNIDACFYGE